MKWETNQSKNIYLCDLLGFAALVQQHVNTLKMNEV